MTASERPPRLLQPLRPPLPLAVLQAKPGTGLEQKPLLLQANLPPPNKQAENFAASCGGKMETTTSVSGCLYSALQRRRRLQQQQCCPPLRPSASLCLGTGLLLHPASGGGGGSPLGHRSPLTPLGRGKRKGGRAGGKSKRAREQGRYCI